MNSSMFKAFSVVFLAALLVAGVSFAKGGCPMKDGKGKGMGMGMGMKCCPMAVEGAEVKVDNTKDGVVITISAKDEETVKTIQEKAASCKDACKMKNGKEDAKKEEKKAEKKK